MYLNPLLQKPMSAVIRLTLTLDVFKLAFNYIVNHFVIWLTLTLDVFK